MTYSIDEVSSIISEAFGDKSETHTKPVEPPTPKKEIAVRITAWEDTEWSGVQRRLVDARELFGKDSPAVLLPQYRGFEAYAHLDVPTIPAVYEPCKTALNALCMSMATGLKTMLVGDTGTGKTSLLEYFAAHLGRPFVRTVFDATTDDQKLFGSLEVRQEEGASVTYFNKSDLSKSLDYPAVVAMDEFSRANAEQTMLINPLLDRRQIAVTSHDDTVSERIVAHDDWFVAGTDNTNGSGDDMDLYNSSNVLDEAIRNRFDIYSTVPYAPTSVERKIIAQFSPDMDDDTVSKLAHFSSLCHKGYADRKIRTAFSIRNLKAICALYDQALDIKTCIKLNFESRVSKSEKPDIAEMVRAIWGE